MTNEELEIAHAFVACGRWRVGTGIQLGLLLWQALYIKLAACLAPLLAASRQGTHMYYHMEQHRQRTGSFFINRRKTDENR